MRPEPPGRPSRTAAAALRDGTSNDTTSTDSRRRTARRPRRRDRRRAPRRHPVAPMQTWTGRANRPRRPRRPAAARGEVRRSVASSAIWVTTDSRASVRGSVAHRRRAQSHQSGPQVSWRSTMRRRRGHQPGRVVPERPERRRGFLDQQRRRRALGAGHVSQALDRVHRASVRGSRRDRATLRICFRYRRSATFHSPWQRSLATSG